MKFCSYAAFKTLKRNILASKETFVSEPFSLSGIKKINEYSQQKALKCDITEFFIKRQRYAFVLFHKRILRLKRCV